MKSRCVEEAPSGSGRQRSGLPGGRGLGSYQARIWYGMVGEASKQASKQRRCLMDTYWIGRSQVNVVQNGELVTAKLGDELDTWQRDMWMGRVGLSAGDYYDRKLLCRVHSPL